MIDYLIQIKTLTTYVIQFCRINLLKWKFFSLLLLFCQVIMINIQKILRVQIQAEN